MMVGSVGQGKAEVRGSGRPVARGGNDDPRNVRQQVVKLCPKLEIMRLDLGRSKRLHIFDRRSQPTHSGDIADPRRIRIGVAPSLERQGVELIANLRAEIEEASP